MGRRSRDGRDAGSDGQFLTRTIAREARLESLTHRSNAITAAATRLPHHFSASAGVRVSTLLPHSSPRFLSYTLANVRDVTSPWDG